MDRDSRDMNPTGLASWCATATLVVALAAAPPGIAATVSNLYTVTVPRAAAAEERAVAEQAAMAKLLIRITGNRTAPLDPLLAPLTAAPSGFTNSYAVDRLGRSHEVGFSRARVEQTLAGLGVPVWGPERPLTLLWIAIDDGAGGRALLGADEAADRSPDLTSTVAAALAAVRAEIRATADERGLPLALPLLDLQDLNAVDFTDIWGRFDDRVLAASQRYRADAVLIGRVRPGLIGAAVDWLFVNGTERQEIPGAAVRDGLDAAADRYAAELRVGGELGATLITVRNVTTNSDYGRVLGYLERQSALERVDVESFAGGTLTLAVVARGEQRVLGRLLALGGVIRPVADAVASGALVFEVAEAGAAQ